MQKRLIFLSFGLGIIFAIALIIAAATVYVNSEEIKEQLITELNSGSDLTITIRGNVEFAFIKSFPNVALELQGVEVSGIDTLNTPFVKAGKVYLLTNFWDMISRNWQIKATTIEDGEVTMLKTKSGEINYQFTTNQPDSNSEDSGFKISIEKAMLKNIRFRLIDDMDDVHIHILVNDAILRGNFSTENLALKTIGNVYSHSIQIKQTDYAREKQISFDGSLSVSPEQESYLLAVPRFIVENNEFVINGSITMVNKAPEFDLTVRGKDIAIKDLPMLLPAEFATRLNGIKGTGKIQVSSEIKGRLDEKHSPHVTIAGNASGATVQIPGMDGKVESLTFKGTFTNGNKQSLATSSLSVTNLSAKTKHGSLTADFTLSNFNKPDLKARTEGLVELSMFNSFLATDSRLREMRGTLEFKNLKYQGKASNIATGKLHGLEGSVSMMNVSVKIDTMKISITEAHIEAYEKSLSIGKLAMMLPGSRFSVTGKVMHMPGLTKTYDTPTVDLTVNAESVNVENILAMLDSHTSESEAKQPAGKSETFGINGFIRLSSGYIGWDKFKAYDASCTVKLNENTAEIKNFSCNTMDGTLDLETKIVMRGGKMITDTRAKGSNLNITEMFYQLNNFNQTTIVSKNVAGNLEFSADVKADFINGELIEKSLVASSKLVISQGQLKDFQPLERLSRFIDIEELRNIQFSRLSNTISISERTVHIPEMIVHSSALNIAVSGKQTFENVINYHVKLNIFDILAKKFRKRKSAEFDYEEAGENNYNFYLSMTGTAENPVIKHERQGGIKERLAQQKDDLPFIKKNQQENKTENRDKGEDSIKEKTILSNTKKHKGEPEESLEYIEWDE